MRRAFAIAAGLGVAMSSTGAAADEVRQAISSEPWGFTQRAVTIVYDTRVARRVSLAPRVGFRVGSTGDFTSRSWSEGLEVRAWITGRAVGSAAIGIVGPYLFARGDVTFTHVSAGSRSLGSDVGIASLVGLGYRFVLWERVELSPSAGLGLACDVDARGRVPPWFRALGSWTGTLGAVF